LFTRVSRNPHFLQVIFQVARLTLPPLEEAEKNAKQLEQQLRDKEAEFKSAEDEKTAFEVRSRALNRLNEVLVQLPDREEQTVSRPTPF
jgi:hypothetical protein